MNAYQLYDAAFDAACDDKPGTAAYVQDYASGAFDLHVSDEICEQIAAARVAWLALTSAGRADSFEFTARVKSPLSLIEL